MITDPQATALGALVLAGLVGRLPLRAGAPLLGIGLGLALARGALVWQDLVLGGLLRHASGLLLPLGVGLMLAGRDQGAGRRRWLRPLGLLVAGPVAVALWPDRRPTGTVLAALAASQVAVLVGLPDALHGQLGSPGLGHGAALALAMGPLSGPVVAAAWCAQAGAAPWALGSAGATGLLLAAWGRRSRNEGSAP